MSITIGYRLFDRYRKPVVSLAVLGDTAAGWRPDRFGYRRWGCEVGIRYPIVKLLDYRERWSELEQRANPFAVIVQAHLKAQEIRGDEQGRYRWKLQLVRSLYERGYAKDDILELFRFIDWVLQLPEGLEERFWAELSSYEEAQKMSYITSVERIGIKKGIEKGIQQGLQQGLAAERQLLLRQIRRRFGVEVAESSVPLLEQAEAPEVLEDLGELLLDCHEGKEWLQALSDCVAQLRGEK
ncbi:hypothetical protein [Nitrosococcus wardiae]|uniref:hypothetical protein n=1 Tax=Nitrosococcus wardiae TaxID=1814290 RepID=UPI00197CCEF8|nr:hypothetical protein [Nitrosococcus wardiae]